MASLKQEILGFRLTPWLFLIVPCFSLCMMSVVANTPQAVLRSGWCGIDEMVFCFSFDKTLESDLEEVE